MSTRIRLAQGSLCLISASAVYLIWVQSRQNGTSKMIRKAFSQEPYLLPMTNDPLRTVYTGLPIIDHQLQVLMVIFWNFFSGDIPASTIQCLHFAGQYVAVLTLLFLEALRPGNEGTFKFYVSLWVGIAQLASFAVTIPIFLALHLGTSPTIPPSLPSIAPNALELASLLVAVTTGFLFPTGLLSLPVPSMATFDQKQLYNAIWQVFPIWVSISHYLAKLCLPVIFPAVGKPSQAISSAMLRLTYLYGLFFACLTHGAALTLPVVYDLAPMMFNADLKDARSFGLSRTFVPTFDEVPSIAEGVFEILKNDEWIGCTALILWASVMLTSSWPSNTSLSSYIWLLIVAGSLTSLIGPAGCALALMWVRDEICLAGDDPEKKIR